MPSEPRYVLYWAQVNRRLESNKALTFAIELANARGLPLLVYEALTFDHPWANDRFHTFVLQGVAENRARAAQIGAGYRFYHRMKPSDPNNMLHRLAKDAAAVVTDAFPCYLPRDFNKRVPAHLNVEYHSIDASTIVPLNGIPAQQYAAYSLRPKIHKLLPQYLKAAPEVRLRHRWKEQEDQRTVFSADAIPELVRASAIDHGVAPSPLFRGGRAEALKTLQRFLEKNLSRYARLNREPSAKATSQLSPYLHFGYISSLEVALAVQEYAADHKLIAEEFLEQLIVRRELAFNFSYYGPPAGISALPAWAQATLAKHERDKRDYLYSADQFERAATHDPLWNACQNELLRDGIIHGYYRMYWGKKILEWSATPQGAIETMIYLNDRYALDGRDPNSYTNILWCLGLHDRPWTERPVFGMIRYMSYDGMRRKTNVEAYLRENGRVQETLF
jgi:deoxyribodipyrimidine photo-lyase